MCVYLAHHDLTIDPRELSIGIGQSYFFIWFMVCVVVPEALPIGTICPVNLIIMSIMGGL